LEEYKVEFEMVLEIQNDIVLIFPILLLGGKLLTSIRFET